MWKTGNCSAKCSHLTPHNQSWWNLNEKCLNSAGLFSANDPHVLKERRGEESWLVDCPGVLESWSPFKLWGKKVLQLRPPALGLPPVFSPRSQCVSPSSIRPDLEINSPSLNLISLRSGLSVLSQFIKNFYPRNIDVRNVFNV